MGTGTELETGRDELLKEIGISIRELRSLDRTSNEASIRSIIKKICEDKNRDEYIKTLDTGIRVVEYLLRQEQFRGSVTDIIAPYYNYHLSNLNSLAPNKCGVVERDMFSNRRYSFYALTSKELGEKYIDTARRLREQLYSLKGA